MLVVNLFGGPGTGKSTFATRLFSELKSKDINSEYVSEYAKDIVWSGELAKLEDQLYITAKQNQKLRRLNGRVSVAVSDSPLLIGLHYAPPYYLGGTYTSLVKELFSGYNNLNLFLIRKKNYNPAGRTQTEEKAIGMDKEIRDLLDSEVIPYFIMNGTFDSIPRAVDLIQTRISNDT